jgi:signal transduction histidine kinase
MSVRARLTLLYGAILVGVTGAVLALSWWLLGRHLDRTLPGFYADAVEHRLALQYVLALLGAALLAGGLGWILAGRALAPAERAAEAQRRFVANASHELRTPLTVIRAETEVTLADPEATIADFREMGHAILETSERTEALLDGLLVLATSSQAARRHEPVDRAALARRVRATAAAEAAEAGVDLHVLTAPATLYGDEALLERLLANLVENAIRHNRPGGTAELSVTATDGRVVVRAVNDGPEVPQEALARLAEPFQRLERSSRRRGAGLGLSIVRAVAEAHGGALRLARRDGGGLEVEVVLPASVTGASAHRPVSASTGPQR